MNRYSPKYLLQQKKTVITAHSGCEGTPDNSREHILAAIASGAEMIEVDVRQAPDGTLILSHDVPEDISVRVQYPHRHRHLCGWRGAAAPRSGGTGSPIRWILHFG